MDRSWDGTGGEPAESPSGRRGNIRAQAAYCFAARRRQAIDTTTPSGRMIFSIFSALGEYERELIRERIMAGQKRARAQGLKIGRLIRLNDAVRTSVKQLRDGGMEIKDISKRPEIGVGSVYGALRAA